MPETHHHGFLLPVGHYESMTAEAGPAGVAYWGTLITGRSFFVSQNGKPRFFSELAAAAAAAEAYLRPTERMPAPEKIQAKPKKAPKKRPTPPARSKAPKQTRQKSKPTK